MKTKLIFHKLKRLFSLALAALFAAGSAEAISWGKPYVFQKDGKYGLMVNEEVCVLPTFDKITEGRNDVFIFTDESGNQGVLTVEGVIVPAIYDEIIRVTNISNYLGNKRKIYIIYKSGDEYGLMMPAKIERKRLKSGELIIDTLPEVQILPPGDYSDFKFLSETRGDTDGDLIICRDGNNNINLIDLSSSINITPYYDITKLGGNIKDVIKGKTPYSQLKTKRYNYQIQEDISKIFKKHPELYDMKQSYRNNELVRMDLYRPEEIMDTITQGKYRGVITTDGVLTIPLEYSAEEDVLARNPTNLMVLKERLDSEMYKYKPKMGSTDWLSSEQRFEVYRKYYNELYQYYNTCVPAMEKLRDYAESCPEASDVIKNSIDESVASLRISREEAGREAGKYNNMASVTGVLNNLAATLNDVASAMNTNTSAAEESQAGYFRSSRTSSAASKSNDKDGFSLSEQTSYNRDKKTYDRYDSQIAAHLAGNQVMSQSSFDNAKQKMKSLRAKWEARGKSFPHSSNEDI